MPLKWFTSYLTNRQQYVSLQTVRCGIPQGSSLGPLLFLLYINDIPNSSNKLSFRIFADDTNIFTSSSNLKQLETTVNEELKKVKHWCNINKLSLNLEKTNYMIIKSPRKKEITINIFLRNNDGTNYSLKRKDHIRYLGVMIDDSVSWKYHIAFISTKISRNIGIFAKTTVLQPHLSIPLICNYCVGKYLQITFEDTSNKTESYCEIDVLCEDVWRANRKCSTFNKSS